MALLLAVASAFMPVDVVLEMLAVLPTPVLATLPDMPTAFWAAVLRLALLEVADPSAAQQRR